MEKDSSIYVTGHSGLVGNALVRELEKQGYAHIITCSSRELDLRKQADVERFFESYRPDYVFLAAARVGGILANDTYKAEFIYDNLMIASNVIHASYLSGAKKLLNLGSSCIYPKDAPQPMKEEDLLTGTLEPTNEPYAIAKIAAIKLCRYYNEQHGTDFISVMPTNLYGPNDNFDLKTSHVLPALIRKIHLGKCLTEGDVAAIRKDLSQNSIEGVNGDACKEDIIKILNKYGIKQFTQNGSRITRIELWGTGKPFREFLHVEDLATCCVQLMEENDADEVGEFVNIGTGIEVTIQQLAEQIADVVGFKGEIAFDADKPDGTPRKLLDLTRITKLGWHPKISLEEGIRRTYQWYTGNGISEIAALSPQ